MTAAEVIQLVHERDRLLARIAEIEAALGGGPAAAAPDPPAPSDLPGVAGERWPSRRRPKGTVTPNGRGWRWQFSLKGMRYTGQTVKERAEAEAGLAAALDSLEASGRISAARASAAEPGVQVNGHGFRWKFEYEGKRYIGPTVDREEEARDGLVAAREALARGQEPVCAPRYRSRRAREAAQAADPPSPPPPSPPPAAVRRTPPAAAPPPPPPAAPGALPGSPPRIEPPTPSRGAAAAPAPQETPWGGFSERTGSERLNPGKRRIREPLIRCDVPQHPVIVDQAGVEVLALDVGPGSERGTVHVRWRIGDHWSDHVDEIVRDAVLRDATAHEVEHGPGDGTGEDEEDEEDENDEGTTAATG